MRGQARRRDVGCWDAELENGGVKGLVKVMADVMLDRFLELRFVRWKRGFELKLKRKKVGLMAFFLVWVG